MRINHIIIVTVSENITGTVIRLHFYFVLGIKQTLTLCLYLDLTSKWDYQLAATLLSIQCVLIVLVFLSFA